MADGHQARLMEFNQFEREFEHCISQSATRTKFEQHCRRATKIIDSLYNKAQWLHVRFCLSEHFKFCRSLMQISTHEQLLESEILNAI